MTVEHSTTARPTPQRVGVCAAHEGRARAAAWVTLFSPLLAVCWSWHRTGEWHQGESNGE